MFSEFCCERFSSKGSRVEKRKIYFVSCFFLVFMELLHRAALSNLLLCFLSQNLYIMSSSRTKQGTLIITWWLLRYLRTNSEIYTWRWIQDGFRMGGDHKFKRDMGFETKNSGVLQCITRTKTLLGSTKIMEKDNHHGRYSS